MLNQPLAGKIAIVTGGGTGIGAAITRDFVAAGARVCVSGRRQTVLDEIANSLPAGTVKTCAGDVASRFDVERMVSAALTFNGTIDVLVNNAGFGVPGGILDLELSDWQRAIDVNLTGPFLMMQATVLHMLKARHGSIINISSIAGLRGTPGTSAYAAAKGGLNMLTQQAAVELGPQNIRCNVVCPGAVRTPQLDEAMARLRDENEPRRASLEAIYQMLSANTPLRRVATTSELTGICTFLASDASSFINGAVIPVDGGTAAVDANGLSMFELPPPH
jgi:meso-butanediol dehydrogenase / (S,S)-butanediol dehydrogenase / diacetyl reductase